MSIILKIDRESGKVPIEFANGEITGFSYSNMTRHNVLAKSTNVVYEIQIRGEIPLRLLPPVVPGGDYSHTLHTWALTKYKPNNDYYRTCAVQIIRQERKIREITFPHAYVDAYQERLNSWKGVLEFELVVRQKKDKWDEIQFGEGKKNRNKPKQVKIASSSSNLAQSIIPVRVDMSDSSDNGQSMLPVKGDAFRLLIYETVIRKNPEDMQYNDKSEDELMEILDRWIIRYELRTNKETYWRKRFENLVKKTAMGDMEKIGLDMVDHFMSGSGTPYRNDKLTNEVRNSGPVQEYVRKIKKIVKELLEENNGNTSKLKYNKFAADRDSNLMVAKMIIPGKKIYEPSFDRNVDLINGLGITIHGFEGNRIELSSVKKNGSTYRGTLHFKLWDNFGLDEEDVTDQGRWGGLRAWYILQHYTAYNGRFKPFQTIIEFDEMF